MIHEERTKLRSACALLAVSLFGGAAGVAMLVYDRALWGTVETVFRGISMLFLGALAGIALAHLFRIQKPPRRLHGAFLLTSLLGLGAFTLMFLASGTCWAEGASDYDYSIEVNIANDSGSDILGPVAVPINGLNLVDGGYMDADADGTLFTDSAHTATAGTGQDLGQNAATWWWWGRRAARRFGLRLTLSVQLLAQGVEGLLDFLGQLLDTSSVITLGGTLEFFHFALDVLLLRGGHLVAQFIQGLLSLIR